MSKRTGSYATTTTLPWKKSTKINVVTKNKKKNARTIINPMFEKCSVLTEDKFWVCVFQNCARGKFPRHFYFKNNLLTYRKGNKTQRLQIPKSTSLAYTNILKFFQEEAGILSKADRDRRQKVEELKVLERMEDEDLEWKNIKTDKIKDLLIMEFIEELAKENSFDPQEKDELITTVKKGFIMKSFNNNNIYMENNKIYEISGLKYNKKKKIYEIDKKCLSKRPGRKIKGLGVEINDKNEIDFMEMWNKYLKNLEEKKKHKMNTYSSSWSTTETSDESSKSFSATKSSS